MDDFIYDSMDVPEGKDATISVKVTLSDFQLMTRAAGIDPESAAASTINDIWVGVYSVNGERTGMQYMTVGQVFSEHDLFREIQIKAKSGRAYIVAVANVNSNNGVNIADNSQKTLRELLDAATTWEAFKNIAYRLEDPQSVQRFNTLVMSGIYLSNEGHDSHINDPRQIFTDNFVSTSDNPAIPAVITPGTAKLDGAIHLRRMSSYVKVNIKASQNIDFTPVSWQICNIPGAAFLNERHDRSSTGRVNAADKKLNVFGDGLNHHNSLVYEAATFDTDRTNGTTYSFDFYQLENKHAGLPNVTGYNDREIEFKTDNLNSGWYSSLVSRPGQIPAGPAYDSDLANNNASYMVIKGKMEYYYDPDDPERNPVNPQGREGLIRRFADAVYTVHLGYCEGNSETEKARDFNCRRNTRYTYNIEILGADKIRVEAQKVTDDPQPGVEGSVTDLRNKIFNVDAHYAVMNISLTENEREKLIWRIQAPFDGEVIDMINGPAEKLQNMSQDLINLSESRNADKRAALADNQFYNWIQFVPISGYAGKDNVDYIAPYPGDLRLMERQIPEQTTTNWWGQGNYNLNSIREQNDGGIWYLEDLRDPAGHPHPDKRNGDSGDVRYWYTVFIDEYVYEYKYNKDIPRMTGNNNPSTWKNDLMPLEEWGTFVNEANRNAWICLDNMYISNDTESVYSDAVYLISQESIQTYYSEDAVRGIGLECTNESYVDRELIFTPYNNGVYDDTDGYLNQYMFVRDFPRWEYFLGNTIQKGKKHTHGVVTDETYYVPSHEADFMRACMSRNRDLNGNGQVEINEVRWYLPTDATYTRIILGGVSLRSPLFNLNEYEPNEIKGGVGELYSHYGASNNRKTWAEEFTSTGVLTGSGVGAGTLRCIRNLGQATYLNPSWGNGYTSIDQAYSIDERTHTITLNYYKPTALRDPTGGHLPAHDVSSPYNRAARRFQYAKEDCVNINPKSGNFHVDGSGYIKTAKGENYEYDQDGWTESCNLNTLCSQYSESRDDVGSWRVPNITELAIMTLLNVPGTYSDHLSCTTEYFDRGTPGFHRYLGSKLRSGRLDFTAVSGAALRLRCVRDLY